MSAEPLFRSEGETFIPSGPARGPWDPNALHGGAPAALLARAIERVPTLAPMRVTRMTFDLVGAVPLAPLTVETSVLREGRRLQVVEAELKVDGEVAMRARALRIRTEEIPGIATQTLPPPGPGPAESTPIEAEGYRQENFATTGMELRFSSGTFLEAGPASCWFRLRMPLVDDETPSPLQRVMAAADFPNGISHVLDFETHLFINPDLTVHLSREPRGEWIFVAAVSAIESDGIGLATATLCDEEGPIGVAAQSLFVGPR